MEHKFAPVVHASCYRSLDMGHRFALIVHASCFRSLEYGTSLHRQCMRHVPGVWIWGTGLH